MGYHRHNNNELIFYILILESTHQMIQSRHMTTHKRDFRQIQTWGHTVISSWLNLCVLCFAQKNKKENQNVDEFEAKKRNRLR